MPCCIFTVSNRNAQNARLNNFVVSEERLISYTIKLRDTATILPVSDAFFIYIFTKLHYHVRFRHNFWPSSGISKLVKNTIVIHKRKLAQLWIRQRYRSPDYIINLSKKELTVKKKETLRFGLDNHILPRKLKVDDIKSNIEKLLYSLKTNERLNITDETRDEIKFITKKFINDGERLCSDRRNIALHTTLSKLSIDPDIKVCKFD